MALSPYESSEVRVYSYEKLFHSEYAVGVALLNEDPIMPQVFLSPEEQCSFYWNALLRC